MGGVILRKVVFRQLAKTYRRFWGPDGLLPSPQEFVNKLWSQPEKWSPPMSHLCLGLPKWFSLSSFLIKIFYARDAQVFHNSRSHLKFLGARKVTVNEFYTEITQIFGATVQNLVATMTWHQEFVNPCFMHFTFLPHKTLAPHRIILGIITAIISDEYGYRFLTTNFSLSSYEFLPRSQDQTIK